MNVIVLAFANSSSAPLPTLKEEDRGVYQVLSKKAGEEKEWHILHNSFASIADVTDDLLVYQDKISVFLYSGHAERDVLVTEGGDANAEGIAALLGACPNLKLVVLNGCSTQGQVAGLLAAGVPCVIATAAPINDTSATQFSIAFFKALAERNKTIEKAYQDGLAAAKTFSSQPIEANRGAVRRDRQPNSPIWGLFHPAGQEINLEWRLSPEPIADTTFIPNKLLLAKTWEAIAPYVNKENKTLNQIDKLDKIITELPHPISEYLRKLIAKSRPSEKEEVFYNELSSSRLQHLLYTYTTCIELLAFTMLAQIWDELSNQKLPALPAALKEQLQAFFSMNSRTRKTYNFLPLLQEICACNESNNIVPFLKEYEAVNNYFKEDMPFFKACQQIESIRQEIGNQETIPIEEAKPLCITVEKQLATILGHLGFMAKYKMASMKDIYFIKQKHQTDPKYKLNFVELRYRPSGMDIMTETLAESMDNASVVLFNREGEQLQYLNLSPFIIDENSFDGKAKLANLCVFQSFEKIAEAFTFRYMYKPLARPLVVRKSTAYFPTLANQFNAFYELLFDEKLIK